jgi:hypothetical protein
MSLHLELIDVLDSTSSPKKCVMESYGLMFLLDSSELLINQFNLFFKRVEDETGDSLNLDVVSMKITQPVEFAHSIISFFEFINSCNDEIICRQLIEEDDLEEQDAYYLCPTTKEFMQQLINNNEAKLIFYISLVKILHVLDLKPLITACMNDLNDAESKYVRDQVKLNQIDWQTQVTVSFCAKRQVVMKKEKKKRASF